MLVAPLRDRFGVLLRLDYYDELALTSIVTRSAELFNASIDHESAGEIASRARGTPRIANRLLKRVRDYAQVRGNGHISIDMAREALELLQVDPRGLDHIDHKLIIAMIERFRGGPVGLDTIAASIGEESQRLKMCMNRI